MAVNYASGVRISFFHKNWIRIKKINFSATGVCQVLLLGNRNCWKAILQGRPMVMPSTNKYSNLILIKLRIPKKLAGGWGGACR